MYAKNTWEKYANCVNDVMEYNEGYKDYISKNKTERACVKDSIRLAEAKGFKPLSSFDHLKTGDKVYVINRDKNIALFIIGEKPLTEGMRILGAHIDSPRMDLKQNPLYESEGFVLADTHYGLQFLYLYMVWFVKKMVVLLMLSLVKMKMIL